MKSTALATILALAVAAPAFAFQRTIDGCAFVQVPGTNYFNLADPSCPQRTDGNDEKVFEPRETDEEVSEDPPSDEGDDTAADSGDTAGDDTGNDDPAEG